MTRTLARLLAITSLALSLTCGVASAQTTPPVTLKSALEAAQKALASRQAAALATPEGKAFLEAQEIVRQLQVLMAAAAPKADLKPAEAKAPVSGP